MTCCEKVDVSFYLHGFKFHRYMQLCNNNVFSECCCVCFMQAISLLLIMELGNFHEICFGNTTYFTNESFGFQLCAIQKACKSFTNVPDFDDEKKTPRALVFLQIARLNANLIFEQTFCHETKTLGVIMLSQAAKTCKVMFYCQVSLFYFN